MSSGHAVHRSHHCSSTHSAYSDIHISILPPQSFLPSTAAGPDEEPPRFDLIFSASVNPLPWLSAEHPMSLALHSRGAVGIPIRGVLSTDLPTLQRIHELREASMSFFTYLLGARSLSSRTQLLYLTSPRARLGAQVQLVLIRTQIVLKFQSVK